MVIAQRDCQTGQIGEVINSIDFKSPGFVIEKVEGAKANML